jgi:2-C-methyl-D-erythritol 4-phosphate cytidylyltransferase
MSISVIIPAAGFGERMGGPVSKQFLSLQGKPVIIHTLERFQSCNEIDDIVIAASGPAIPLLELLVKEFCLSKVHRIVEGGVLRQDSVWNAFLTLASSVEIVLVHDAVRPFIKRSIILESIRKAHTWSAAVAAVPVKDTVKISNRKDFITSTAPRASLWLAQTPQTFRAEVLRKGFLHSQQTGTKVTDDASLVEMIGIEPAIVIGSYDNIKITTPDDLENAEIIAHRFIDE